MSSSQPKRKKKTNAEKSAERKKVTNIQQQEQKRNNNPLCWSDVKSLHNTALNLLYGPTMIAPLLRDKELMAKVPNQAELRRLAGMLVNDLNSYKNQLNEIRSQWEGKSGRADDAEDLIQSITIAEAYENWVMNFTNVVLSTAGQITDMINPALPTEQQIKL